jgi:hypothetical protein
MLDPGGFQLGAIVGECTRVFFEILAGTELQAVDEDGGDHLVGMPARLGHQRDMAFVQVAHGRHQRHTPGPGPCRPHAGDGIVDQHVASAGPPQGGDESRYRKPRSG